MTKDEVTRKAIDSVNEQMLRRAERIANRAQRMLHRPEVSGATWDNACEMLRQARNLTARAYGQPERY